MKMGNKQSSPPSSRSGCTDPNNDCKYILYEHKDGSGWQHRICGETQHAENALKGTSRVKINKKGCMITLNSSEKLDGSEAFLEATTDGEVFDLTEYDFNDTTKAYITSKKPEIDYTSLFSNTGNNNMGGLDMKLVVLGIGFVVIILYMVMKTGGNEVEKNSLELLQDIREDRNLMFSEISNQIPPSVSKPTPTVSNSLPTPTLPPSVSKPVPSTPIVPNSLPTPTLPPSVSKPVPSTPIVPKSLPTSMPNSVSSPPKSAPMRPTAMPSANLSNPLLRSSILSKSR